MKWLGYAMLAAPFIGIFAWVYRDEGFRNTLIFFGAIFAFVAWVFLGVRLALS